MGRRPKESCEICKQILPNDRGKESHTSTTIKQKWLYREKAW